MKIVCLFNNKGGVAKTTTAFHLGWKLSKMGKRVLLVDADPQCNLTGLSMKGDQDEIWEYYENASSGNIFQALAPAFNSEPRMIEPVSCIEFDKAPDLFLLPGHVSVAEYEASLVLSQQISETVGSLRNLPGSLRYLLSVTAEKYEADVVLVDLSPGLGAINQNLVATSDYVIAPLNPDTFSIMALRTLAKTLPEWRRWADRMSQVDALKSSAYPFEAPGVQLMGVTMSKYSLRNGQPSRAFKDYISKIEKSYSDFLIPALSSAGVCDPQVKSLELASIPDFASLAPHSQRNALPVFELDAKSTETSGSVWDQNEQKIALIDDIFVNFATEAIQRGQL